MKMREIGRSKALSAMAAIVFVATTPFPAVAQTPEPEEKSCLIEIDTPWGRVKLICGVLN